MQSTIWTLNWRDFGKGAVVAVGSAVIASVIQAIQNGGAVDYMAVANIAVISFLSYLLKNLSTDENGKIGGII